MSRRRTAAAIALVGAFAGLATAARVLQPQDVAVETLTLSVDSVALAGQPLISLRAYEGFTVSLSAESAGVLRFRATNGAQSFEVVYLSRGPNDGGPGQ